MSSSSRQPPYFLLTLLFLFLSLTGWGLISLLVPNSGLPSLPVSQIPLLTKYVATPTSSPVSPTLVLEPTSTPTPQAYPSASPTPQVSTLPSPSIAESQISPTLKPTASVSPSPTPTHLDYKSEIDNFSVQYSTSRKVYQDKEKGTINRYTFYRSDSSFAIHIGPDWSWTHPSRVFDKNDLLSGLATFRYQAADQILIDLESPSQKITLQCIHHGSEAVKTECQKFVTSFKYN